jgi:hypothetical protein
VKDQTNSCNFLPLLDMSARPFRRQVLVAADMPNHLRLMETFQVKKTGNGLREPRACISNFQLLEHDCFLLFALKKAFKKCLILVEYEEKETHIHTRVLLRVFKTYLRGSRLN